MNKEKIAYIIAAAVIAIAYIVNLGVQPLFLEEPRRIMIALELLENNNLIVPTQLGELYHRKPPIFNWILIAFQWVFGQKEWVFRLPTVLSTLGLAWIIYKQASQFIDLNVGRIAALSWLTCGGILLYFSNLAEIDLFYALLTTWSILGIYYFNKKEQYAFLFLNIYVLSAIGFLTKGLSSIPFLGISLLVYFIIFKQWKKLLHWQHWLGCFAFFGVLFAYFYTYHQFENASDWIGEIISQSSERTAPEQGNGALFQHLFTFPLEVLGDLMPGSLFLIFGWRKDFFKTIRQNDFVYFAFWIFVANIIVYWISPGAKMRYLYPIYPFFYIVAVYVFLQKIKITPQREKAFHTTLKILIAILALATWAIPFIPALAFLKAQTWVIVGIGTLAFLTCLYYTYSSKSLIIPVFFIALGIARLLFDCTVLPQRAHESDAQRDKVFAQDIHRIVGNERLYLYKHDRISFTTIVYLDLWRKENVKRKLQIDPNTFFIIEKDRINFPHQSFYSFEYHNREHWLIRKISK